MSRRQLSEFDFKDIRPARGRKDAGFEELCVQLFQEKYPDKVVVRVEGSGGDGGVEAYWVDNRGGVVALQSKYFAKLGTRELVKIRSSVVTARKNHPTLKRYIVCSPHDRNPANVEKWRELVSGLQKEWNSKVTLEWWGIFEISNALLQPGNALRALWWFGCKIYTREWLAEVNRTAFDNLDSRYTPERHVKLEVEKGLQAFVHSKKFREEFDREARNLCNVFSKLEAPNENEKKVTGSGGLRRAILAQWKCLAKLISNRGALPAFGELADCLLEFQKRCDQLSIALYEFNEKLRISKQDFQQQAPLDSSLHRLRDVRSQTGIFVGFLRTFKHADSHCLLLTGEAGAGKSHLIANWMKECEAENRPAFMILGESFLASHHPLDQMVQNVGWDGTGDELLAAMNGDAEASLGLSVICIDALNESAHRSLWRTHLLDLSTRLKRFPRLRLLVSCRSDFREITLPQKIENQAGWSVIEHRGFGARLFEAVKEYFRGYRVRASSFPPLLSEFQNPLFLKTVCEAFEGELLPSDSLSLDVIMGRKVGRAAEKIRIEIDCPPDVTERAIEGAAEAIRSNRGMPVSISIMRKQVESLFPASGESVSLYRRLVSHGLLVESASFDPRTKGREIFVRFPYERFSDHFIARRLLDPFQNEVAFRKAWEKGEVLPLKTNSDIYGHRGILRALAILLPERFGIEVVDLKVAGKTPDLFLDLFLESLAWRGTKSFGKRATQLVDLAWNHDRAATLKVILSVATVPGHPFNGDYLDSILKKLKLPVRERDWTIPIAEMTIESGSQPDLMVKWALEAPMDAVSNKQALICATAMAWFFSTNHQAFRYRATLAVIRLLQGRPKEAAELVKRFGKCNDPYVAERVYAVAAGVAMRERRGSAGLKLLAQSVFEGVFSKRVVYPHVLLRDYASCVIEYANFKGCLPSSFSIEKCRPPYNSSWPKIPSEAEMEALVSEDTPGWYTIIRSLRTEGMGSYGDFGRYVMGTAVHEFSSVKLSRPAPDPSEHRMFSDRVARCWVLHRIMELGWSTELFEKYEENLPHRGRQRVDIEAVRLERISKKYQWIALRELQGLLLDHFHHSDGWRSYSDKVCGAWGLNLVGRDFDPSQPLVDMESGDDNSSVAGKPDWWLKDYPDPFIQARKQSRKAWVDDLNVADFLPLIDLKHPDGSGEHLALAAEFLQWREPMSFGRSSNDKLGELRMWVHFRSWLIPSCKRHELVSCLQSRHFWGAGLDLPETEKGWLGEYPWAQSFAESEDDCANDRWIGKFNHPVAQTACKFGTEGACDTSGLIPSPQLLSASGSSWSGSDLTFTNDDGVRTFLCDVGNGYDQCGPLMARKNDLIKSLAKNRLSLVWTLVGERVCLNRGEHSTGSEGQFSAVYWLDRGTINGGLTRHSIINFPTR